MSLLEILIALFVAGEMFAIMWRVKIDAESMRIQRFFMEDKVSAHKLLTANANQRACSSIINEMIYDMETMSGARELDIEEVISDLKQAQRYLNNYWNK